MLCYKLTNQDQETKNDTKWNIDEWNAIKNVDASQELCSEYWLHAYQSSLIAVLMNPIHAQIDNPRLFEAEAEGEFKYDGQCKFGCTRLRIIKEIKLPRITKVQRIKIAIYCALEVYKNKSFTTWARNWLSGKDRSAESAKMAYQSANGSASDAYANAYAASYASYNAAYAAASDAYAIKYAVRANPELDVLSIINKVLKEKV